MKSKLAKILCLVMGAILLVTGTVAVTLAYLQDLTDSVTNTMTIGKVDIDLDESKVTVYGVKSGTARVKANTYKLIPGQTYVKDPTIKVIKGSEECYVFFGIAIDTKLNGVLDTTNNVIATQLNTNNWLPLQNTDKSQVTYTDTDGTVYNIYYNKNKVAANDSADQSLKTFEKFSVGANADVSGADTATIKVKAFAVQTANLSTPQVAWENSFKQSAT